MSANVLSSGCRASPEAAPSAPGCCSRRVLSHPITARPPHHCPPPHPVIAHSPCYCSPPSNMSPPTFFQLPAYLPGGRELLSPRASPARRCLTQGEGTARLWCGLELRQPHGSWASTALLRSQGLAAGSGDTTGLLQRK